VCPDISSPSSDKNVGHLVESPGKRRDSVAAIEHPVKACAKPEWQRQITIGCASNKGNQLKLLIILKVCLPEALSAI
jgi:hypothetical protein